MSLILKGGAVFLHIPKTGGNWIISVLRECGLAKTGLGHKHANMDRLLVPMDYRKSNLRAHFKIHRIKKHFGNNPYTFCFVRHPLAWYESRFKYMTQPSRNWRHWGDEKDLFDWHPQTALNGCGSEDFNQFVQKIIEKRPGYVTELFGEYAKPPIDFIGKQETLKEDLVKVLKHLNLNFDEDFVMNFKEVGVSPAPHQKLEWNADLTAKTLNLEQIALLRYGYPTQESTT
ncbi:sulfotransferase family 2 domain-containing protein [bacterium]|nr:sulfotransferase family 2 domain-containing protein [bacterium]